MTHQCADESRPLAVVSWRRHIPTIVEDGVEAGGKRVWHEAQLDEGPHPDGEKEVPDAIYVEERVEKLSLMTDKRSHVVREQAVKAHMTKAQLVVASPQLFLPVGAQRYWGMIAPN